MEEARNVSGIESVHWFADFESLSREVILENDRIYCSTREERKFRPEYPSRDERYLMKLKEKYPAHTFSRLTPLLWRLRAKKEPEELDLIREAIRITSDGFRRVLAKARAGLKEYQLEAELTHEFIRNGSTGHAYPPIIASGENACYLHYIGNDAEISNGQLLLMDFGAEYGNYAADCTRTFPVSGDFTPRQLEIYKTCLDLFKYARSLFKPGATLEKINEQVWIKSREGHLRLGLYSMKDVKKQKKDAPLHKKYLMHGISHYLGLDVHDAGQIRMPLEEGMVITCEPGIYIPEEKTGVRLENDLLITAGGCEDLMDEIPMDPDEIRELMAGD
jgi:Xaa-Pro aminopeptidase